MMNARKLAEFCLALGLLAMSATPALAGNAVASVFLDASRDSQYGYRKGFYDFSNDPQLAVMTADVAFTTQDSIVDPNSTRPVKVLCPAGL